MITVSMRIFFATSYFGLNPFILPWDLRQSRLALSVHIVTLFFGGWLPQAHHASLGIGEESQRLLSKLCRIKERIKGGNELFYGRSKPLVLCHLYEMQGDCSQLFVNLEQT